MYYKLHNEGLNEVLDNFVLHVLLWHVGLSWVDNNNNSLKFKIEQHLAKWIQICLWYNTIICSQLSRRNFEAFSKQDAMTGVSF